jgi:hypothetical protein
LNDHLNTNQTLTFPVIQCATKGDVIAINTVINYYRGYINKLSTKQLFDAEGNANICLDEELSRRLETKLITRMLSFRVA